MTSNCFTVTLEKNKKNKCGSGLAGNSKVIQNSLEKKNSAQKLEVLFCFYKLSMKDIDSCVPKNVRAKTMKKKNYN